MHAIDARFRNRMVQDRDFRRGLRFPERLAREPAGGDIVARDLGQHHRVVGDLRIDDDDRHLAPMRFHAMSRARLPSSPD